MEARQSQQPNPAPLPPGPPWYRIPDAFRTSPPTYLLRLAREYGDVVRFRGVFPVYCINHPEYVRQILTRGKVHVGPTSGKKSSRQAAPIGVFPDAVHDGALRIDIQGSRE